jgi:hypothetical protein
MLAPASKYKANQCKINGDVPTIDLRIYFHERRSNNATIEKISAEKPKPARNPAVVPRPYLFFSSPRKNARL